MHCVVYRDHEPVWCLTGKHDFQLRDAYFATTEGKTGVISLADVPVANCPICRVEQEVFRSIPKEKFRV